MRTTIFSTLSLLASAVAGIRFPSLGVPIPPDGATQQALQATTTGTAFFEQLIDHNDPSKGTFQTQYWWNSEFWEGPGSPVVLFTPGEAAAAPYVGYLTNQTIVGLFAQEIKGAAIVYEHRYYGASSPFDVLTVENLQMLTVKQAVADLVYFARNVELPFGADSINNAPQAPWVLSGGSYSGALSAWTESVSPGTFWAYHASSAPVEAIKDYWQYFAPIQEGMPQNCSADVSLVIDHIDSVLTTGTAAEKNELKAMFGLEVVEHDADFASALQNGPFSWQGLAFYTGYSAFFQWCDAVENVVAGAAVTPGPKGVGLQKALAGYAAWIKENVAVPELCEFYGYASGDFGCLNSFDPNNLIFTNLTVDNPGNRQWNWILCNEPLNYWEDGAPTGRPTIVSRLVNVEYWARQCGLWFPFENGFTFGMNESASINVNSVNKFFGGWSVTDTTRLTWTNGQFDPWNEASVSSEFRPGGKLQSTAQHPVNVIPDGVHCYDLIQENAVVNPGVQHVVDVEVAQMVEWVAEFYQQ